MPKEMEQTKKRTSWVRFLPDFILVAKYADVIHQQQAYHIADVLEAMYIVQYVVYNS